jgi:hypothetical protein
MTEKLMLFHFNYGHLTHPVKDGQHPARRRPEYAGSWSSELQDTPSILGNLSSR